MAPNYNAADWEGSQLLQVAPNVRLRVIVEKALNLWHRAPEIERAINADRDQAARAAKRLRLQQAEHDRHRGTPGLDDFEPPPAAPVGEESDIVLENGRPATPAVVIYLFMVLRGAYNSVSDTMTVDRFHDSYTLRILLRDYMDHFPGVSTLVENLGMISSETHKLILRAQLQAIREDGYDSMDTVLVDSTASASRSAWPTDSGLLYKELHSACRLGQQLARFQLPHHFRTWHAPRWLKQIKNLDFQINTANCDRQRTRLYVELYGTCDKLLKHLGREYERLEPVVGAQIIEHGPLCSFSLSQLWEKLSKVLCDAWALLEYSADRRLNPETAEPRRPHEEIFSVSDEAARFIRKGGRDTVFGFKPQLAQSRHGFVTALRVHQGNVADSAELTSLVAEHQGNTQQSAIRVITADDGYSSKAGREALLKQFGESTVVSISGSKGKKLIGQALWDRPEYQQARRLRAAVESPIFVLKQLFAFGRMRRGGLAAVTAEMYEKVIAYNFHRAGVIDEKRAQERRRRYGEHIAA